MKQILARAGLLTAVLGVLGCQPHHADRSELLWPSGAPRAQGRRLGDTPRLYWYLPDPEHRTDLAVVVAGGGSYGHHAGIGHEAEDTAQWLVERGITAVVVRYRVGRAGFYNHQDFSADGRRSVRVMRSQARDLGIDPEKIGMIGYSAGGHLAAMVSNECRDDEGDAQASDPVERESCRLAFAVLVYPVITMDDRWAHRRSRDNLLNGIDAPSPDLREALSMETRVGPDTPPTALVHSRKDKRVDWNNSRLYHEALVRHGVPAQLWLFDDGRHGVGIADDPRRMPQMSTWPSRFHAWLQQLGLLSPAAAGGSPGRR